MSLLTSPLWRGEGRIQIMMGTAFGDKSDRTAESFVDFVAADKATEVNQVSGDGARNQRSTLPKMVSDISARIRHSSRLPQTSPFAFSLARSVHRCRSARGGE